MIKIKLNRYRCFAVLIIFAFVFSTFGVARGAFVDKKQSVALTLDKISPQDKEIITQISNTTGVKPEDIIKLKTTSNTWNDVLDKLRTNRNGNNQKAQQVRNDLLTQSGLDADTLKKLRDEGFSDSKITEAKALVSRVTTQLQQILDTENAKPGPNFNGTDQFVAQQDIDAYKELASKIHVKPAVELLLKLENAFGSMEKVLNEYLLSLQIGVDLNEYLTDKEAYEKAKNEQIAKLDSNKLILVATIESKVLEVIQNTNHNQGTAPATASPKQAGTNDVTSNNQNELPTSPLPDVQNTNPPNPQEDLMKEVNDLRNKSLSY